MTTIWFLVVLFCLAMYIVFDGYDFGIGIASLFEKDPGRKRRMIELVATGWDGNETWLILLGLSLWAGFPLAFGVILPHLYLPLIVALFALIVRGGSVELISQTANPPRILNWAFGLASLVGAFAQGFALGQLTSPAHIVDGAYTGTDSGFPWYSVILGATVTLGYTALGYSYLKHKSEGMLHDTAARRGGLVALVTVVFAAASFVAIEGTAAPLNLGTPGRAVAFWGLMAFAVVGAATAALNFWRRTDAHPLADVLPFAGLVVTTVATLLAFTVSHYPVLVPPALTVSSAAGPYNTMVFLLVGVGLNIPLVIFYHWFAHRTFRGKFRTPEVRDARTPTLTGASHER
ncbi:MAG: cytochrome bd ubiquinol oxidase subunit [Glaciihabitans sp.]|nr:cytochrome bd ubiquinol oxidase subunit [Glaciihabitans sp.]